MCGRESEGVEEVVDGGGEICVDFGELGAYERYCGLFCIWEGLGFWKGVGTCRWWCGCLWGGGGWGRLGKGVGGADEGDCGVFVEVVG